MDNILSSCALEDLKAYYQQSLQHKVTEFTEALQGSDFESLQRLGHQMKGSGRSFGFPEITEFGVRLEEAALNRRFYRLQGLLVEFINMVHQLNKPAVALERS